MALGCIALIVSVSVLSGYEETIEETALSYLSHIEVRPADGRTIYDGKMDLRGALEDVESVTRVEPLIVREALARTRDGVDGVALHGMTADRFERLTGKTPGEGAFIGAEVARRLDLQEGDTAVIYAADDQRDPTAPVLFSIIVDGIVETGMQSIDESIIAMDIDQLKTTLRMDPEEVSMYSCTVDDPSNVREISSEIAAIIPGRLMVITWEDRYHSISSWIELQKEPVPIVLGLISIVAVFTVISTLLVAVVEKARSFAVLITIGMKPKDVMMIVALRALRIGINGSLIGVGVALAFALIQRTWEPIALDGTIYYVSALPVSLSPLPYLVVPVFAIVLTLVASIIPMVLARKLQPAQVLRFS